MCVDAACAWLGDLVLQALATISPAVSASVKPRKIQLLFFIAG